MIERWWADNRGPEVAARDFFPPKHFSRRRWVGRIFTRKLSAVELSAGRVVELPGNLAGQQLDSQKSHWEDTSRGMGAMTLVSCLGVPHKDQ